MIAPFFADVDTRGGQGNVSPDGNSTGANRVYLDFDQTNGVITITWDDVGYYNSQTNKVNAFQLRIFNDGDGNFSFEFRYENVDWTTGSASGGSNGLGGQVTHAGWTAGDGVTSTNCRSPATRLKYWPSKRPAIRAPRRMATGSSTWSMVR